MRDPSNPTTHKGLIHLLATDEYNRERAEPRTGESHYLALSDLKLGLAAFRSNAPLKLLDYGCGSSPYRSLFPNTDYRRADYLQTPDLDYRIEPEKPLDERDGHFDLILSTQVLEHVSDYMFYLRDCHRLLKPNGRLILTTHGSFPDHSCPYDYQRWTVGGLTRDLGKAGFSLTEIKKLTAGPRSALFYVEWYSESILARNTSSFGFAFGLVRRLIRVRRKQFHEWADRCFAEHRVVSGSNRKECFYVGILVVATPRC